MLFKGDIRSIWSPLSTDWTQFLNPEDVRHIRQGPMNDPIHIKMMVSKFREAQKKCDIRCISAARRAMEPNNEFIRVPQNHDGLDYAGRDKTKNTANKDAAITEKATEKNAELELKKIESESSTSTSRSVNPNQVQPYSHYMYNLTANEGATSEQPTCLLDVYEFDQNCNVQVDNVNNQLLLENSEGAAVHIGLTSSVVRKVKAYYVKESMVLKVFTYE
jgi:hypothetical protein